MKNTLKTDLGNSEIFARNLKRCLDLSGKTQKEVADDIHVSTGTFCDWMKCRSYPRMDKIQLLAEYFGVTKSELVDDVPVAISSLPKEDQDVLDAFHKVPKEKREFVLSMIRSAAENL